MKIRTNYVSNSSSSSFVVVAKRVGEFKHFNDLIFDKDKTYFVLGDCLDEGTDMIEFKPEKSLFKYMQKNVDNLNIDSTVYELIGLSEDELELAPSMFKNINKDDKIIACNINADYHSTTNTEDLEDRYGDN